MKTACFTGHRPNKLNGYNPSDNIKLLYKIREVVIDHIENKNVTTFISGMALGVDMWSARIILKLKEKYPHLKLISAIPCDQQYFKWTKESVKEWKHIISKADEVYYISKDSYTPWCMQKRNEWMVDNSQYVIGIWDGTSGGTANCIKYAIKKNSVITQIHPKTLEVSS